MRGTKGAARGLAWWAPGTMDFNQGNEKPLQEFKQELCNQTHGSKGGNQVAEED